MVDDGRISLRQNTEFKLDDYNFKQEEPSTGRMFVNLLRGSLRSITGLIGRNNRSGYRVRTPHATLGVRGTDHETTVLLAPRNGAVPGTFDQVYSGQTVMRTPNGEILTGPKQVGFVAAVNSVPKIIPIPKFLQNRAPVAAPPAAPGVAPAKRTEAASGKAASKVNRIDKKSFLLTPLSNPKRGARARRPDSGKAINPKALRTPNIRTLAPLRFELQLHRRSKHWHRGRRRLSKHQAPAPGLSQSQPPLSRHQQPRQRVRAQRG
jgi:hypothetical protein